MAQRPKTTVRKRPRQARARVTVEALLDATAQVLMKDGYDGLSTNRVALVAGVSVGSLYQYFPSKEALVAALLDHHSESVRAMIDGLLTTHAGSPCDVVATVLVSAMIDLKRAAPRLAKVLREETPRVGRMRRYETQLAELVERVALYLRTRPEVRVDDVDLAAFMAVHAADHLTHSLVTERPEVARDVAVREITAFVVRALGVPLDVSLQG